jgi:hypothetical protein
MLDLGTEEMMATSTQPHQPATDQDNAAARSENLLPDDGDDDDGRFDVAEEVNLDQQSDRARHIGQAPDLGPEQDGVPGAPAPR